jgi:hypothetical protein
VRHEALTQRLDAGEAFVALHRRLDHVGVEHLFGCADRR